MLRFAPSPTGNLHIGNARIAVLNFLYAKNKELDFFLRIDDTDSERSDEKYVESIIGDLSWLGINFSKVIRQSERLSVYNDVFNELKKKKLIYPCFETQEELSLKRKIQLKQGKPPIYDRSSLKLNKKDISDLISNGNSPHWRLKLDEKPISWNDEIHGLVKFDNLSISDPVLFRSDEMPLFTITSVVDDVDLKVTHILRGDDHITNTAAQIKLFQYLGSSIPNFAHFPLMRTKSGSGLSKRFNSFSLKELKEKKILPFTIVNYLTKIGSSLSIDNSENLEGLIKNFDVNLFSKNSVLFNDEDLVRINSKNLKELSFEDLNFYFKFTFDEKFWKIIRGNIEQFDEIQEWYDIVSKGISVNIKVDEKLLHLIKINIPERIDLKSWQIWTKSVLEKIEIKPKDLFITIRMLLTGKKFGPSMNELLTLFTKKEILKRIEANSEK
ncbi:MAG: glutamate--tRNA ligase [Alphaproteobacteria bacterium]|nr:glutamate--tRNA ligase [Alphaproteobacteria bacterium]